MPRLVSSLARCAALACGCAASEDVPATGSDARPVYRTGSNIPVARERGGGESQGLSMTDRRAVEGWQRRPARPGPGAGN
jgi:hypothetical protein